MYQTAEIKTPINEQVLASQETSSDDMQRNQRVPGRASIERYQETTPNKYNGATYEDTTTRGRLEQTKIKKTGQRYKSTGRNPFSNGNSMGPTFINVYRNSLNGPNQKTPKKKKMR